MIYGRYVKGLLAALITVIFLAALLVATNSHAQEQRRPELAPEQKLAVGWAFANALTSFVIGAPVFLYVTVTGKQKELCDVMKGTYDPTAKDICAGGDWVRVIPYLPKPERN
jgi:hypothetical protein